MIASGSSSATNNISPPEPKPKQHDGGLNHVPHTKRIRATRLSNPPALGDIEELINANIFALPSFSPGSGPYAARRGEIIGPLKPEQRASLATLYCALMCVKRLEDLNVTHGDIIADGNFAQNAVLCSLIATLKPAQNVYAARDHSGTARGAAILAHWHEAREPVQTTHIEAANLAGLQGYYEKWKAMIG